MSIQPANRRSFLAALIGLSLAAIGLLRQTATVEIGAAHLVISPAALLPVAVDNAFPRVVVVSDSAGAPIPQAECATQEIPDEPSEYRAIPIDLVVDLPGLQDDDGWIPGVSPLDDVLLVDGAVVESEQRGPFPGWRRNTNGVRYWRDFATVRPGAGGMCLAVMVSFVPVDPEGKIENGVVQLRAGELALERHEVHSIDRITMRLEAGPHDVILRVPCDGDGDLAVSLIHANARNWFEEGRVRGMLGSVWPQESRLRRNAHLPVPRRTLVARDDAGELALLGVPRGWMLVDGVTRLGADGRSSDAYVFDSGVVGRCWSDSGRESAVVLGAANVIDCSGLSRVLPRFDIACDPGIEVEHARFVISKTAPNGTRQDLAIGDLAARDENVRWRLVGDLGTARGSVAALTVSASGMDDFETVIAITPDQVVAVPLIAAAAPWLIEVELVGVDAGLAVPISYSYRPDASRPVVAGFAWVDGGAPMRVAASGRVDPRQETRTVFLDAEVEPAALERAVRNAWRAVFGTRPFEATVWVETDFANQAKEAPQGSMDVARRVFRHREHVRLTVAEGDRRCSLAEFVAAHQLREAFESAARAITAP